jgi:hypothetical protein
MMDDIDKFIPLDKSWIIRMGVLDILHGYDTIDNFLKSQEDLGSDVQALHRAYHDWKNGREIHVGQSATLYRFLKFASWSLVAEGKKGFPKIFIPEKTLIRRIRDTICDDPEIIHKSLDELLNLRDKTSQWASASVVYSGDWKQVDRLLEQYAVEGRNLKPFYKLKVARDSVKHWTIKTAEGSSWESRPDPTLKQQAVAYLNILKRERPDFEIEQAEDYCFARAFKYTTSEQGAKDFPSLPGHESDRIEKMETLLKVNYRHTQIESDDHRVVQAIAMHIQAENPNWDVEQVKSCFTNPNCVDKSMPLFWEFMEYAHNLKD